MSMKISSTIILIYFVLCCSCHRKTKELSQELSRIDSIMWEHPDSALTLLGKMPKPSLDDKLEYATWCLLMTQAQDKNRFTHTSDSLINISLRFFERENDWRRKAQALFYKGQVAQDLGHKEEAVEYYVKAEDMLEHFHDPLFASLVYQTLGSLYRYQSLYEASLHQLRNGVQYALLFPEGNDLSHAYSQLGRTFFECGKTDSARYYFERSLEHGKKIGDLKMQSMAIGELGVVFRQAGNLEKALEYKKKELTLDLQQCDVRNLPQTKYGMAGVFYEMGELDSAKIYFEEALNTSNVYTKRGSYKGLYLIAKKQGKYQEAIYYNDQVCIYNDSITDIARTKAMAEVQLKYDHMKLENEKKDLKLRNIRILGYGVCLVFLLISVIATLVNRYQRKLLRKECLVREAQENIQKYIMQLYENEQSIKKNEELILIYTGELQDKEELEKLVDERRVQLDITRRQNGLLQDQIQSLQQKIQQIAPLKEEKNQWIHTFEDLSEENKMLKSREIYLLDYLGTHIDLFKRLREGKDSLKEQDWYMLKTHIDLLFDKFTMRLQADFPGLTEYNLKICCLIKMRYSTSRISTLLGVSAPSITRQKLRIREFMSQQKKELTWEDTTLETYLSEY